jgi:DNA repair exonuclease SbcCD ATPase subunit
VRWTPDSRRKTCSCAGHSRTYRYVKHLDITVNFGMATADISGDSRQNNFVRSALEANVVQLKGRVKELTDDLEFLRTARSRVSTDTQQFVQYATTELKAKDEVINELRAQLREISYSKDVEARKVRAQMESAFDDAVSEHRQVETQLREALRAAELRLQRAQQYLERREELETRVEELQTLLDSERAANQEAFQQLERKYLLERSVLVKSHESSFVEMKRQARAEAIRALDSDTKRVLVSFSSPHAQPFTKALL